MINLFELAISLCYWALKPFVPEGVLNCPIAYLILSTSISHSQVLQRKIFLHAVIHALRSSFLSAKYSYGSGTSCQNGISFT
jgi:hypothetical protein